ncbi:kinesin-like protein Klp8 [Physocladia obscura]|uniref:Kinesin-like protein Klp8 n=1 Tax=Physocladia obscura TaxID=109957 RepID=A0AAD5XK67_9FUNG|nr:kinesin-like protein Klp8 [Physocladia obscura]
MSSVKVFVRVRPLNARELSINTSTGLPSSTSISPVISTTTSATTSSPTSPINNNSSNSNSNNSTTSIDVDGGSISISIAISTFLPSPSVGNTPSYPASISTPIHPNYNYPNYSSNPYFGSNNYNNNSDSASIISRDPPESKNTTIRSFSFTFDHVFLPPTQSILSPSSSSLLSPAPQHPNAATQAEIYDIVVGNDLLDHAFNGYNVCLFAYGQTGSGKSYTMMGISHSSTEMGVIPRTCQDIFSRINESTGDDPNKSFTVMVSYIEIYNEKVRDLLSSTNNGTRAPSNLRIREHPQLGPYVEDLSRITVTSYPQIERLLDIGNKSRTTAATNMNDSSSRSHAVFTVNLTQTITITSSTSSIASKKDRSSRICLVDLAGSERADATGASGVRLKEGASINKSLTTLGKVISALADSSSSISASSYTNGSNSPIPGLVKRSSTKSLKTASGGGSDGIPFIPYRDSILTWLLKDCLGGNSKTVMLATISPAETAFDETLSTLRYAERAKRIVTRAIVNEDETGRAMRLLQIEVEKLRRKLALYEGGGLTPIDSRRETLRPVSVTSSMGDGYTVAATASNSSNGGGGDSDRRRLSILSDNSVSSDPEALKDQLIASEKLIAEMTGMKGGRMAEIEANRVEILKDLGINIELPSKISNAVGVLAPKTMPHLVNLSEDPLASDCLLYRLPVGQHRVGATADSAIYLQSTTVMPEHAYFECKNSKGSPSSSTSSTLSASNASPNATLQNNSSFSTMPKFIVLICPISGANTYLNNIPLYSPTKLSTGDRVQFGDCAVFKFVDPTLPFKRPQSLTKAQETQFEAIYGSGGRSSTTTSRSSSSLDSRPPIISRTLSKSPTRSTTGATASNLSHSYASSQVSSNDSILALRPNKVGVRPGSSLSPLADYEFSNDDAVFVLPPRSFTGSPRVRMQNARRSRLLEPLNSMELILAKDVVRKWRNRNYVKLAQDILKNAVLLKEANIISRDLEKNVMYEFEIIDNLSEFTSVSFWETTSDVVNRSRQASAQSALSYTGSVISTTGISTAFGTAKVATKPFLAIRVLDGEHNSVYSWTLPEFMNRLSIMRTLYDYPDSIEPSKYYDQRAAKSEMSFYGGDEAESSYPRYRRIGLIYINIKSLQTGILKEIHAPVISQDNGETLGWVLVILAPISTHPVSYEVFDSSEDEGEDESDVKISPHPISSVEQDQRNQQSRQQHRDVRVGDKIVFEVSILELTGISEKKFTQVHCQFRLSEFTGRSGVSISGGSISALSSVNFDRIYSTDPVDGFGAGPVRWNFSQTISLEVTTEVKKILDRGIATFEIFGRHIDPVSTLINERFATTVENPSPAEIFAPSNPRLNLSENFSAAGTLAKKPKREHVILAQLQISELSHSTGDFKPVPVQTNLTHSDTLKAEFRSPADIFLIRQGIQRRITLRLSHSGGKFGFPWRRISYFRVGKIRRIDLKTNRPLEDESESSEMINIPVTGIFDASAGSGGSISGESGRIFSSSSNSSVDEFSPPAVTTAAGNRSNRPHFSNNGQSFLEIEVPWDSSIHNNVYLNKPTKNVRLEVTVEWGVEIDPLNDNPSQQQQQQQHRPLSLSQQLSPISGASDVSQWSVFASPAHFEKQIGIIVHDRDFKVKISALALNMLSTIGVGSGSAVSATTVASATPLSLSTRHASQSSSLFVVETYPVSSSLAPKVTSSTRALMRELDTRGGYVRGQESLGSWMPGGQEIVEQFWRKRDRLWKLQELAKIKSRIEEHEMVVGVAGDTGSVDAARFRDNSAGKETVSQQDNMVLVAKCIELWRNNSRWDDPCLNLLLYDRKHEPNPDDSEEVKFVSTKCRLTLEIVDRAPASFRGPLLTPNEKDVWIKRYFVIRRPYLHMFGDAFELDELAIFSLVNSSVQFGADLGAAFQGKPLQPSFTSNIKLRVEGMVVIFRSIAGGNLAFSGDGHIKPFTEMEIVDQGEYVPEFPEMNTMPLPNQRLPRAKLTWDKQRTLWRARDYKGVHSIFLVGKVAEQEPSNHINVVNDGDRGGSRSKMIKATTTINLLPIKKASKSIRENEIAMDPEKYHHATNALYSAHMIYKDESVVQHLHNYQRHQYRQLKEEYAGNGKGEERARREAEFFTRLANPKCPGTPPLPLECTHDPHHHYHSNQHVQHREHGNQEFFERLYHDRPHERHVKAAADDIAQRRALSRHVNGIHAPGPETIDRLAKPKIVCRKNFQQQSPLPCIGAGKVIADLDGFVTRLAKPRYFVVWKNKKPLSSKKNVGVDVIAENVQL